MRVVMATEDLREALIKTKPKKPDKRFPILTNSLLDVTDGKVVVTTNDSTRVVKVELEGKADSSFSVVLPSKTVEKFLHGANGEVTLTKTAPSKTTQIIMERDGLGQVKLEMLHKPEDFPQKSIKEDLVWQSIDAKWFCRMLDIAVTACAQEESRPILTGVCLKDGSMASADGFRLVSLKDERLTFGLGEEEAIVSYETMDLVRRLFRKDETLEVAVSMADVPHFGSSKTKEISRIYFRSNGVSVDSNVIQGNYPKYEQLIPDAYNSRVSFSAPLMAQRLEMIDEIDSGILRLSFEKDKENKEHRCLLTAQSEELFDYSLTLPVKIETEEEGRIAFNIKYFKAMLKPFSLVTLELTSGSSPGKFTGDIEGLTIVIMPMFVQW